MATVAALTALAQGMRLRLFRALVDPGVLAATLGGSASTLSFHLKELTHVELVSQERDGRHLICTHNSARSIMAEGMVNSTGRCGFVACLAGSQPRGEMHPLALATLAKLRLPTDGHRSKCWSGFARADAPQMDFVFTVGDNAAGEACPVWPDPPMTAHRGVPDPSAAVGDEEPRAKAFWNVVTTLKRRFDLMLALPLASLDRLGLQREIREIGAR